MTQDETYKVLGLLKSGWPGYFRQMGRSEAEGMANLWCRMLADYPVELVTGAVERFLVQDTKGYPPSIGQVIASINAILHPPVEEMTESEAWSCIQSALKNGGLYHAKKEYDKLPPVLRRIVGSSERLHDWALMDADTVETNIRAMICRSYTQQMERARELTAIPPTMARQLAAMAERPALESPEASAIPSQEPARLPQNSGESPAMLRFFAALKDLAGEKAINKPESDDIRLHDAEAREKLKAQYRQLKEAADNA